MRPSRSRKAAQIPPKPAGFDCRYPGVERNMPIDCPTRKPSGAAFLGAVSWSWSPANDREESYYLSTNRSRSHWILWQTMLDRLTGSLLPSMPYAYGPKRGVPAKVAAAHLLIAAWRGETQECLEVEGDLDAFHMIDEAGMFTERELEALADLAWPDDTTVD